MKLSIVIPCYNEEKVIRETHGRLQRLQAKWVDSGLIEDYEVIYVDDGSEDSTLDILKELTHESKKVKVITFSNNFGHQAALTAGLCHSNGDAVISLDADLQDPPQVMESMIHEFRKGNEVVFGVRRNRDEDTLFKRFTAETFYKLMQIMGVKCIYNHADYRLLSKRVIVEFRRYSEVNRFLRGMIPLMGFRYTIVEYDRDKRYAGETKYPFRKMLAFAIEGITSFSSTPLRLISIFGCVLFIGTLLLSCWALVMTLFGATVPGWASTVLPTYFLGGVQLMFLGVVGEYVGRIYMEVKHRPIYIIKERYNYED
jgi:glycosyltransferase involved in cell wall biosynthesis